MSSIPKEVGGVLSPQQFTVDIHQAAKDGDLAEVKKFFEEGGDANTRCRVQTTALHRAAYYDKLDVALCLLDHGAEVDARDPNGQTPLYYAAKAGSVSTLRLLLARGAYINALDRSERTPMFAACTAGKVDTLKLLLDVKKCKLDVMDKEGLEPGEVFDDGVPEDIQQEVERMLKR
ncbi:unnamed protein product [Chrysoparadoxa australica]